MRTSHQTLFLLVGYLGLAVGAFLLVMMALSQSNGASTYSQRDCRLESGCSAKPLLRDSEKVRRFAEVFRS